MNATDFTCVYSINLCLFQIQCLSKVCFHMKRITVIYEKEKLRLNKKKASININK